MPGYGSHMGRKRANDYHLCLRLATLVRWPVVPLVPSVKASFWFFETKNLINHVLKREFNLDQNTRHCSQITVCVRLKGINPFFAFASRRHSSSRAGKMGDSSCSPAPMGKCRDPHCRNSPGGCPRKTTKVRIAQTHTNSSLPRRERKTS